jgi:hypothetical protein
MDTASSSAALSIFEKSEKSCIPLKSSSSSAPEIFPETPEVLFSCSASASHIAVILTLSREL